MGDLQTDAYRIRCDCKSKGLLSPQSTTIRTEEQITDEKALFQEILVFKCTVCGAVWERVRRLQLLGAHTYKVHSGREEARPLTHAEASAPRD